MKQMVLLALIVAALAGCGGGRQAFQSERLPENLFTISSSISVGPCRSAPKSMALPAKLDGARYYRLGDMTLGDRKRRSAPVWCVVGSTPGANAVDVMWVDWNNDKRWEGSEKISFRAEAEVKGFGKLRFFDPAAGAERRVGVAFFGDDLRFYPSHARVSTVSVEGKPMKIGLVDNDLNGFYDDWGHFSCGDKLLLDRNRDGEFELGDIRSYWQQNDTDTKEVLGVLHAYELAPGKFYELKVVPDGSNASLERMPGQMGKIQVKNGTKSAWLLWGKDGPVVARSGSLATVPPGEYRIVWGSAKATTVTGDGWTIQLHDSGKGVVRQSYNLKVQAGQILTYDCLGKLSLDLVPTEDAGRVAFSVVLRDPLGNWVTGIRDSNWKTPGPPELRVYDAAGRQVFLNGFSYG